MFVIMFVLSSLKTRATRPDSEQLMKEIHKVGNYGEKAPKIAAKGTWYDNLSIS